MTKEELKPIDVSKYTITETGQVLKMNKNKCFLNGGCGSGKTFRLLCETYENKIAELEAQIEKMKCCEMCKHKNLNWGFSPICEARDNINIENPLTCKCDKWEIKE